MRSLAWESSGSNLTPDKETGLGNWTKEQIVTAIQTGVRPDGRILSPIMSWESLRCSRLLNSQILVRFWTVSGIRLK
jgi:hypothetical protein